MVRWALLLVLMALMGACDSRPPSEFHLLRSTSANAQLVDFSAVRNDGTGITRVTVISVTKTPFTTPHGEVAQYGHARYAFDCLEQRYRGEGITVYGPDFTKVDEVRETSPWREITDDRGLREDFRRFCASPPIRTDLATLSGPSWKDAADAAISRIAEGAHQAQT